MKKNHAGRTLARMTYSVPEAATILGIGHNSAYEAVKRGDVRAIRVGGRIVIPVPELERLIGVGLGLPQAV